MEKDTMIIIGQLGLLAITILFAIIMSSTRRHRPGGVNHTPQPPGCNPKPTAPRPDYNPPSQRRPAVDEKERDLWCKVLVESMTMRLRQTNPPKEHILPLDVADQAVDEYRKRYGTGRNG